MNFLNSFLSKKAMNNGKITIWSDKKTYSLKEVISKAKQLNTLLELKKERGLKRVLIISQNSLDWVIADTFCLMAGIPQVSIPLSFTSEQVSSLIENVDLVLADKAGIRRIEQWKSTGLVISEKACRVVLLNHHMLNLLDETEIIHKNQDVLKVIHTSGSTGSPKGVLIADQGLKEMILNLDMRLPKGISKKYLSIVPLSLLIEQVAYYLTIMRGGEVVLPGEIPELLGEGASVAMNFLKLIREIKPSAMAVPPSMAKVFYDIAVKERTENILKVLFDDNKSPFFTCGGAPVSKEILEYLNRVGVEIYQGYGLSENSSVVSINVPGMNKVGSVGKPLNHVDVKLNEDNELLIKSSSMFLGYTNSDDSTSCTFLDGNWLRTGDIASIDEDGYIFIHGRIKNVIINSNGRNIAPEWFENQYKNLPEIEDMVVFNNGTEFIEALIIPNSNFKKSQIIKAIKAFEISMGLFCKIGKYHFINPNGKNELFTISGKPNRKKISAFYNY